jgi:hypothetical protein
MADLKVNNITNYDGTTGPVIAGVSTVLSTSHFVVPVGNTFKRSVTENIVNDGLVLYLDAGNDNSYPGSGTTWTDLSGNNNTGTLTNGPTYSSANGGSIVFDGSNDYVDCGILGSYGSQMSTNSITLDFAIKTSYTAGISQFGIINSGTSTLIALNFNRDENDNYSAGKTTFSIRDNSGKYLVGAMSSNIYTGNFFIVSAIRTVNTNTVNFYVNGNAVGVVYGSYTENPASFSNFQYPFTIGATNNRGTIGSYLNCDIPFFRIYNRALSAAEVSQNYNALRSRYGI